MRRERGGSPALAVVLSNLGITVLWPVVPPYLPLQLPSSSSCLPQRPLRTEVGRNNLEVPSCLARRVCTSRQVLGDIQSCFVPRRCCNWPASAHASNSSSTRLAT
ncbi:hypothetical protein VFPBJ_05067 [Purpureocillium lilacinum]|uniref:Uncharacterized protein n=1 Tax=Purpureocillium lilacinum TaxID=33203 RepID=A0A179GYW4_PURLI|nr:hypothetical protein VFPBJ_05067 [Purpureocillium lilacinum]